MTSPMAAKSKVAYRQLCIDRPASLAYGRIRVTMVVVHDVTNGLFGGGTTPPSDIFLKLFGGGRPASHKEQLYELYEPDGSIRR